MLEKFFINSLFNNKDAQQTTIDNSKLTHSMLKKIACRTMFLSIFFVSNTFAADFEVPAEIFTAFKTTGSLAIKRGKSDKSPSSADIASCNISFNKESGKASCVLDGLIKADKYNEAFSDWSSREKSYPYIIFTLKLETKEGKEKKLSAIIANSSIAESSGKIAVNKLMNSAKFVLVKSEKEGSDYELNAFLMKNPTETK
jgi:hypothetical protein